MQAERSCLGCEDVFMSNGPGNRFCSDCIKKKVNVSQQYIDAHELGNRDGRVIRKSIERY